MGFFGGGVASSESIEAWICGNAAVKSKAIVKAKEFADTTIDARRRWDGIKKSCHMSDFEVYKGPPRALR